VPVFNDINPISFLGRQVSSPRIEYGNGMLAVLDWDGFSQHRGSGATVGTL